MTRAEKNAAIEALQNKLDNVQYFYLADASTMTVAQVNDFRRKCFEKGVEMKVVKNTLAQKAMETAPEERNFTALFEALRGPTAILFTDTANVPAKLLKDFRKQHDRPLLKAAYIDTDVFVGDDQIDVLAALKSREELLGEVIGLLQSPAKNVLSALQSGGSTIAGLLKTLEERAEQ